jgi:hypothetical protein
MSNEISIKLVVSDGKIDQDASREVFDNTLAQLVAQEETELSTVGAAVDSVLAANAGKHVPMDTLGAMAAQHLNADVSNFGALSEVALNYVRANASTKREDGKAFRIGRGRGQGGVIRWSDVPVEAPKASK